MLVIIKPKLLRAYPSLPSHTHGKEWGGVIHRVGGRDRAYRPEIVNSISVFRNERLNGGIQAESKRF